MIATDHAPHTLEEKSNKYLSCPSGAPLVQYSLPVMFEYFKRQDFFRKVVEKMCHNPAILFEIEKEVFVKEGYKADLVLINPNAEITVSKENILSKCGLESTRKRDFHSEITHTFQ